jgi:hypothetical protein
LEASQASAEDPASSQAAEQAAGDRDAAEEEYDEVFVHISQQQLKQLKQQAMQDMAAMASSSAAQQQALAPGQGTVTWVSSCDAMWAHVRKLLGKLSARAGDEAAALLDVHTALPMGGVLVDSSPTPHPWGHALDMYAGMTPDQGCHVKQHARPASRTTVPALLHYTSTAQPGTLADKPHADPNTQARPST